MVDVDVGVDITHYTNQGGKIKKLQLRYLIMKKNSATVRNYEV